MTISRYWRSLKTKDFDRIDRADTVVILPLAAIEQHGPHLPLDVDLRINEGIVAAAAERAPENPPFLILPTQAIGFSAEHTAFLGSLTWSPTSSLIFGQHSLDKSRGRVSAASCSSIRTAVTLI